MSRPSWSRALVLGSLLAAMVALAVLLDADSSLTGQPGHGESLAPLLWLTSKAQPEPRKEAPIFGISEPGAWRTSPPSASPQEIASLVAQIGARSQRFWVFWETVEPLAPSGGVHHYDFSAYDQMYAVDLAQGLRPLITVQGAPAWAATQPGKVPTAGAGAQTPPVPSHYADWRAFVSALTKRYPQAVGIEVWNEPNLRLFWNGPAGAGPDPAAYAALLREAHGAVKSANSTMPVIGGALSNNQVTARGDVAEGEFAGALLGLGAARYMDGLSVHPYPDSPSDPIFDLSLDEIRFAELTAGVRKPLWITELGVTTTGPRAVSEQRQAAILLDLCSRLKGMPDVAAYYMHPMIEPTGNAADPEMGYALTHGRGVGTDFQRKPAFWALRHC